MGMTSRLRRWHYVWTWRLRYWWLDTRGGRIAQWVGCGAALLVCLAQVARMWMSATMRPPGEPVQAVAWWVVQLVILIISAAISYAMRPKPQAPEPAKVEAPTVEDGQSVKHHFGTVWVEDEFILAWKLMGTIPIKTKGGKK